MRNPLATRWNVHNWVESGGQVVVVGACVDEGRCKRFEGKQTLVRRKVLDEREELVVGGIGEVGRERWISDAEMQKSEIQGELYEIYAARVLQIQYDRTGTLMTTLVWPGPHVFTFSPCRLANALLKSPLRNNFFE